MKTAMCLKEYVRTSRLAGGGVSDGHCVALFIFLEYLCDVRPLKWCEVHTFSDVLQ